MTAPARPPPRPPAYRWLHLWTPCTAPAKGEGGKVGKGRCGFVRDLAPATFDDGTGTKTMGLHPALDPPSPSAPAGGWQCRAGHMGWIRTDEVVEYIPPNANPFEGMAAAAVAPKRYRGPPVAVLIARDGPRCCWCGRETGTRRHPATVEHLLPRSRGGTDNTDNLAVACYPCNNQRSNDLGPPARAFDRFEGWATALWWGGKAPWGRPTVGGAQGTAEAAAAPGGGK